MKFLADESNTDDSESSYESGTDLSIVLFTFCFVRFLIDFTAMGSRKHKKKASSDDSDSSSSEKVVKSSKKRVEDGKKVKPAANVGNPKLLTHSIWR